MKQVTCVEKLDPLTRIQEEIKEVVRREQEYRQISSGGSNIDETSTNAELNQSLVGAEEALDEHMNMSLTSSNEDQHSDDSGISAASSANNAATSRNAKIKADDGNKTPTTPSNRELRYIGPNCYKLTPEPPQQQHMQFMQTIPNSSFATAKRPMLMTPAQKGVMQRFISSRGKFQINTNSSSNKRNVITLNAKTATSLLTLEPVNMDITIRSAISPTPLITSTAIERDSEGKPIRPGYIPVSVKIQRELNDLKSRESELKKNRKMLQSTSELQNLNNIMNSSDEDSDSEHCFGPGKLRSAKSFNELSSDSIENSLRLSPNPNIDDYLTINRHNGMRPAMSLAQLCDLDPEEAPSSHQLIAQWENLILQNA